ncbi:hypothetical protein PIB30_060398 [Stylosanthes scabra]|uniref:Uncharacterized protein n=1 Tax=Stylosanthes scabra TaxID=79078 RepID=A0ABU6ZJ94_9FABA|nr:hypothetical protein [Stylosanthes scabra]
MGRAASMMEEGGVVMIVSSDNGHKGRRVLSFFGKSSVLLAATFPWDHDSEIATTVVPPRNQDTNNRAATNEPRLRDQWRDGDDYGGSNRLFQELLMGPTKNYLFEILSIEKDGYDFYYGGGKYWEVGEEQRGSDGSVILSIDCPSTWKKYSTTSGFFYGAATTARRKEVMTVLNTATQRSTTLEGKRHEMGSGC